MTTKSFTILSVIAVSVLLYLLYNFMLPSAPYEVQISNQVNSPEDDLSISEFFINDFVPAKKASKIYKHKGITNTPFPWRSYKNTFPEDLILVRKQDEGQNQIIIFFDDKEKFLKFAYNKI